MKKLWIIPILALSVTACSVTPKEIEAPKRYATRQVAPEPVYSRVMWTHPSKPIAEKANGSAPLMMPVISFELINSNIEEAIEALAQTIGYNWHYPKPLGRTPVSIKMVGSVEEILSEIGRQGGVSTILDHERRLVRVVSRDMMPSLPGY